MKLPLLIRATMCTVIIAASSLLMSCEGRAKIAFDNGYHGGEEPYVPIILTVEVTSKYSTSLNLYLNIENYYSDKLYNVKSLDECGIFYRRSSEGQGKEKSLYQDLNGGTAYIKLDYLTPGISYTITPFVVDDDFIYRGDPLTVSTKSY